MTVTESPKATTVTIDGETHYPVAHMLGGHWNGFARPLFTREVALEIVAYLATPTGYSGYDADANVVWFDDLDECEAFGGADGFAMVDGVEVYGVGLDGYAWELTATDDAEEV